MQYIRSAVAIILLLGVLLRAVEGSSPEELDLWIGQMLMVGFRGTELPPDHPFLADVRDLKVGGVILFDYDVALKSPVRNIQSKEQVRRLTSALQSAAARPLFIAVDQEGGRVARLKPQHGFPPLPSQAELGRLNREEATRTHARRTAKSLAEVGINVNFAPVVDLFHPDNPVIGRLERSYGADTALVIRHARWTIEEFQRKGILSAVKHFPGHGSSREDSHLGLPDVTAVWSPKELEPFAALIREGLTDMVMTAHLFNRRWDPDHPATLSERVLTGVLRQELGFEGVIVSDDMQMGAIRDTAGWEEALERAIRAGVDVLLFGNNLQYEPEVARKAAAALKDLVAAGKIPPERLRQSFLRIERIKKRLNE